MENRRITIDDTTYELRPWSYKDGRRENLLESMAAKLEQVDADGIEALVNYYASY